MDRREFNKLAAAAVGYLIGLAISPLGGTAG